MYRLIIFTRFPEPHKTKTRLIPALGPEGAAEIQRRMTRHTLDSARELVKSFPLSLEVRFEGGTAENMAACFGNDGSYRLQGSGDLGCRMERAFAEAFAQGAQRAVIIGTDCPDLTPGLIRDAFQHLETCDLVLGPAVDGGYYLIGLRQPRPSLFGNIRWGSKEVLERTVCLASELTLDVVLLKTLSDVDRPEDLPVWYRAERRDPPVSDWRISIIIPTFNEAANLPATLDSLKESENTQIIVADGGSSDRTCKLASAAGCHVLNCQRGRAVQINAGADIAEGGILLLLHADTRLPTRFDTAIRSALARPNVAAGAFRLRIDASGWPLRLIERAVDLRSSLFQMPYGDQAVFLRSSLFHQLGRVPLLPIMEDFELVRRLRRHGKIELLSLNAVTSGRRWKTLGPWRTTVINQWVILGYYLGIAPERLARWYGRVPPGESVGAIDRGPSAEKADGGHRSPVT